MIIDADKKHIDSILKVTKSAFAVYKEKIKADVKVKALDEKYEDVLYDIQNNKVFVSVDEDGCLNGCIRVKKLSDDIAYIFRYSVDPKCHSQGVGSALINHVFDFCKTDNTAAIVLHSNAKNFELAKFYYGKGFYIHSTNLTPGYVRALFIKELKDKPYDLSPALNYN